MRWMRATSHVFSTISSTASERRHGGPFPFAPTLESVLHRYSVGDDEKKPARKSLGREHDDILPENLTFDTFGLYLAFVNRKNLCRSAVAMFNMAFTSPDRHESDAFARIYKIAYSGGAPGVGKTTWARKLFTTALNDAASSTSSSTSALEISPKFRAALEQCSHLRFRLDLRDADQHVAIENLDRFLATLILREHLKYSMSCRSDGKAFWSELANCRDVTIEKVADFLCKNIPEDERIIVINLDEVAGFLREKKRETLSQQC